MKTRISILLKKQPTTPEQQEVNRLYAEFLLRRERRRHRELAARRKRLPRLPHWRMKKENDVRPIPQPATSFAGKLQRWRSRRKLTQEQASRELGVPYKTLVNWEQALRTPPEWQQKLLLRFMKGTAE
jgi:DNA-binding transcriptional regulator YiaG